MFPNFLLKIDYYLLVPAVIVVFISFFVLSSFAPELARSQALYASIGIGLFLLLQIFHIYDIRSFSYYAYVVGLIVLISLFFIGEISRGSNRWIPIWGDLRFQPSEFAKPILVVALARIYSLHRDFSWKFLAKTSCLALIYFILVFLQPDLGTALVFAVILGVVLYSSNISRGRLLTISICLFIFAALAGPPAWNSLHDYQRDRVITFLNPQHDPLGKGYNAIQAIITVGSGGVFGKGLGQGTQSHNKFLPEQYTDFAFATFSEEFGFIGVLVLFTLYGVLLWRILSISERITSRFGYSITVSVAYMIFFQIFVNTGMNTGLMPITGITLPFFSYGGSSLISFFICLGLVQIVAREIHTTPKV